MKKILLLSLAVMLFAQNVWAECEGGHQCWKCGSSSSDCYADFNPETGHLEITGNGAMTSVPWGGVKSSITSVDIQGVTSIASEAFRNVRVDNIVIPDSVTAIGSYAFWDGQVGRIYCPSHLDCMTNQRPRDRISYDKIGEGYQIDGKIYDTVEDMKKSYCSEGHQCWNCGSMSANCKADFNPGTGHLEITGNGAMTSVPWNGVKSSITSVDIQGVTSIASEAFRNVRVDNIVIPDSVTAIGSYAFWDGQVGRIYCPSHLDCMTNQRPRDRISYDKVGDYYSMNGKMYRNLENMLNGIEMKRIYTVSEAEDALGKNNKNTFSIRYR